MKYLSLLFLLFILLSCQAQSTKSTGDKVVTNRSVNVEMPDVIQAIVKSDDEWKEELSDTEYYVLRNAGTERSFTGDLWDNKKEGVYVCRGCNLALFSSDTKYKSGTGWPSFYEPIKSDYVGEDTDYNLGYARTEVHCARCGGHLGHVFPDGPKPTGLRYCINSVSLDFVADMPKVDDVLIENDKP